MASMGKTLRDLETRFEEALENLQMRVQVANEGLENLREYENRELVESISAAGRQPALACMLRMCAVNTPSRFSVTYRDINDIYARKMSQHVRVLHVSFRTHCLVPRSVHVSSH